jgi:hypothetical protein
VIATYIYIYNSGSDGVLRIVALIALHNLLNNFIFAAIDIDHFGYILALGHNKIDFLLGRSSQNLPLIGVDNTLHWLVISVASVICAWGNCIRLFVSSLLCISCRFDSVEELLIEPSIIPSAMRPSLRLLVLKVVLEEIGA